MASEINSHSEEVGGSGPWNA